MKSVVLFLVCLILVQGTLFAQVPSNCTPLPQLVTLYSNDVKDLALQRIYALHSPDTALISIPQSYQDTVLAGLAAICNTDSLIQADSIFRAYCIHQFPYGNICQSVMVKVDTLYSWTRPWAALNTNTGNAALDSFMAKYGFEVKSYNCISSYDFLNNRAVIATNQAINTKAFADSLALFGGVVYAYPVPAIGEHDYIKYTRDSMSRFEFSLGWTDCISGCWSRKNWAYAVDNSCNVNLVSVNAYPVTPYPEPPNCNLIPTFTTSVIRQPGISVYPNPTNDVLHINLVESTSTSNYSLTDLYGRIVGSGVAGKGITTLNISQLSAGMYVLKISGESIGTVYRKVVVE